MFLTRNGRSMWNNHLAVVMTTYFLTGAAGKSRAEAAITTLATWVRFLKGAVISFVFIDDGSDEENWNYFKLSMESLRLSRYYVDRQKHSGLGNSLNLGFQAAYTHYSPIVAYMVDDWSLTRDLDVSPWIKLLQEREDVGMVRLGPPHPGISGQIEAFTEDWQGWGLRLEREGFAYAQRPALYHKRFTDAYGWWEEGISALECERLYMQKIVDTPGPDIILALPHPWRHIDTVSLSSMEPK